jgi:hypothetical protein
VFIAQSFHHIPLFYVHYEKQNRQRKLYMTPSTLNGRALKSTFKFSIFSSWYSLYKAIKNSKKPSSSCFPDTIQLSYANFLLQLNKRQITLSRTFYALNRMRPCMPKLTDDSLYKFFLQVIPFHAKFVLLHTGVKIFITVLATLYTETNETKP